MEGYRKKVISIKVSETEYYSIGNNAKANGLSVSQYVREQALKSSSDRMKALDDKMDKLLEAIENNSAVLKERTEIENRAFELIGKGCYEESRLVLETCPDFE